MMDAERQRDLEALHGAIYRDKVLRARAMAPERSLAEAFELTDRGCTTGNETTRAE